MNNISLIGRLTAEVELKKTPSDVPVCSFCIAVKRPNVKDKTDFINCVAWRNTAEFISKYFGKGKMIAITGILTSRSYDDKNGNKHTVFEVVAENVEFCGDKNNETAAQKNAMEEYNPNAGDDELPF